MVRIDEVAERLYRATIHLPLLPANFLVFFLDEGPGAIIDPGSSGVVPQIEEVLDRLNMRAPGYVIPTHMHMDHGGAAGALARRFPSAQVLVHPLGLDLALDPSRLIRGTQRVWGEDFADRWGAILPVPAAQVRVVEDGEHLKLGERELEFVYSPGHNDDHIVIFDHLTRFMICGEALGAPSEACPNVALPYPPPPKFDPETYVVTVRKLAALDPSAIFIAHHEVSGDPKALIASVCQTTPAIGAVIEDAWTRGEDFEVICRVAQEYVESHFCPIDNQYDIPIAVAGYLQFFERKRGSGGKQSGGEPPAVLASAAWRLSCPQS